MASSEEGARLLIMTAVGFLLLGIGQTGKPGSVIAAFIDPGALQEGTSNSSSGGAPFQSGAVTVATSGTLTPYEIAWYAQRAGFSGTTTLTIATAIALAESGGNTAITNHDSNGTTDYGLWQINSVHSQYNTTKLLDPGYNAGAAFLISGGGNNWTPWSTYNNGRYLQFMAAAAQAVAELTVLNGGT